MRSTSARNRGLSPDRHRLDRKGRIRIFLGGLDGSVMQRKLLSCVSEASPKGLTATGPIQRTGVPGLWWCDAQDVVTGEARGKRWIQREGDGFRVLKASPVEEA